MTRRNVELLAAIATAGLMAASCVADGSPITMGDTGDGTDPASNVHDAGVELEIDAPSSGSSLELLSGTVPRFDPDERLCAGASTPDDLDETTFIDCDVEGGSFAPSDVPPTDELVVVAYNVERGFHIDEHITLLDGSDPDIPAPDVILVSEADRGCDRTDGRNISRDLAEALDMNYAFAVEFVELRRDGAPPSTVRTCEHGNAILSRYPLGNVRALRHADQLSWYYPPEGPAEDHGEPRLGGRVAVVGDVLVGDALVRFYSIHYESRGEEVVSDDQAVEVALDGLEGPEIVVIGGDTNAPLYWFELMEGDPPTDPVVTGMTSHGYVDAHAPLPFEERVTRPPLLVLDLLLSRGAAFTDPGVCGAPRCEGLSDHLPVWATLQL